MKCIHEKSWNAKSIAVLCMLFLAFPILSAQEEQPLTLEDLKREMDRMKAEYERRIANLELELELSREMREEQVPTVQEPRIPKSRPEDPTYEMDLGVSPGLLGSRGQTDRFSSVFNPAVGVVIDTIGNITSADKSRTGMDEFFLRSAELNIAAEIDPFGYGYATFGYSDSEEEVEVVEAVGVFNRLPANFSLKGGKMLADITKFGQRHDHELPFVEKPRVLYDYIDGSLNGTGAELHQWFGLTDEIPVRWSAGMFTELEGHAHPIGLDHEHHHDDHDSDRKRHLDNFSYGSRLTSYMDIDEENSIQVGGSLFWAPDIQREHEEDGETERVDTRRTVGAVDVTYKWQDPSSRRAFILGAEGLLSNGTFIHEEEGEEHEKVDEEAVGGYLWGEYKFNPQWSTGFLVDAYATQENSDVGQRDYSVFLTWNLSHFNRLRLQYRFNDLERGEHTIGNGEDYHELMLQWTVIFGTHSHGLDW